MAKAYFEPERAIVIKDDNLGGTAAYNVVPEAESISASGRFF